MMTTTVWRTLLLGSLLLPADATAAFSMNFTVEADSFRNTHDSDTFATAARGRTDSGEDQYSFRLDGGKHKLLVGWTSRSGSIVGSFFIPRSDCVDVSFEFILDCGRLLVDSDESYGEVLVSIDHVLYGVEPNDFVHECVVDHDRPTDWLLHSFTTPKLSAGAHTLRIGGFSRVKSKHPESYVYIHIQNIRLVPAGGCTTRRTIPCRWSSSSSSSHHRGGGGLVVVHPSMPTNPEDDASTAIQEALVEADRMALEQFASTPCTIQVPIPAGIHRLNSNLMIYPRIHLKGAGVTETVLVKLYNEMSHSVINLGDNSQVTEGYMHLSDFTVRMQDTWGEAEDSMPLLQDGHCIRAAKGLHDFEIRRVKLKRCTFYGIGLQQRSAGTSTAIYKDFSIQNVKIQDTNSDGIDIKALTAATHDSRRRNRHGEFENIYLQNIGRSDPGWAAAIDLAGDRMHIKRVMAINAENIAIASPKSSSMNNNGIVLRGHHRRVTNTLVEDFYIKGYDRGIGIAVHSGSMNVSIVQGTIAKCKVGAKLLTGTSRIAGSDICLTKNDKQLADQGTDNVWDYAATSFCPVRFVPAFYL